MCSRFSLKKKLAEIQDQFNIWNEVNVTYEKEVFSPTDPIAVIIPMNIKKNKITLMRWGLIPNFIKDFDTIKKYSMFNARSENLEEKASFQNLLNTNRCLIPTSAFYEFKQEEKKKDKYEFTVNEESIFAMAGLWDKWINPKTKEEIYSCTILTTTANEIVKPIHENNRMPVILEKESYHKWLNPNYHYTNCKKFLTPYPESKMKTKMLPAATQPLSQKNKINSSDLANNQPSLFSSKSDILNQT